MSAWRPHGLRRLAWATASESRMAHCSITALRRFRRVEAGAQSLPAEPTSAPSLRGHAAHLVAVAAPDHVVAVHLLGDLGVGGLLRGRVQQRPAVDVARAADEAHAVVEGGG